MNVKAPILDALVLCAMLALLALSFFWTKFLYTPIYTQPDPYFLHIEPGMTASDVLSQLKQKQLIHHTTLWRLLIHLKQVDKKLHAGEFVIDKKTTPSELLYRIVNGYVVQYSLTFVEGSNLNDWFALLKDAPIKRTLQAEKLSQFIKSLSLDTSLEGWLYPDTYFFPKDTQDTVLFKNAYLRMKEILEKEWENRDKKIILNSPYKALILGSIVEKETGFLPERPLVARVLLNRIEQRIRLQADPTVVYALGKSYNGNLTKKNLKINSPFNTYLHYGLPPTPIAMPSKESIHAVLHPADAPKLLYFVAKGDGSHYFSKTLKEHNAAVKKYLLTPQESKQQTEQTKFKKQHEAQNAKP